MNKLEKAHNDIFKEFERLDKLIEVNDNIYYDLGVLQELVERATPKKPSEMVEEETTWLQCPICSYDTMNDYLNKYDYCPSCGQALDWSTENE